MQMWIPDPTSMLGVLYRNPRFRKPGCANPDNADPLCAAALREPDFVVPHNHRSRMQR
jgi:hypothetical protein